MGHLGNKTYQHSFLIAKEETEGVFFISFFSSENIYKFSITSEEQNSSTSEEEKNNIQVHLRKKKTIFKSPKVILKIEIKTVVEFIFHFMSLP